jgi:hypothetical protein
VNKDKYTSTNIHALSGDLNPRSQRANDEGLRLRERGHWDRLYPIWTGFFAYGVKRPGPEADHSSQFSGGVKNEWRYTPTPHTQWMGQGLLKHQGHLHLRVLTCMAERCIYFYLRLGLWSSLFPSRVKYRPIKVSDIKLNKSSGPSSQLYTGYWLATVTGGISQSVPCNCNHFLMYCLLTWVLIIPDSTCRKILLH